MLTIKGPIQLKSSRPMNTVHHDMEEKIKGNYAFMSENVRREELLHITTSSPELYFEQGGTTNILNEITSQSRQEFRLDVINNLMNRILLSNTENFTYQDNVYVSNVLRKIGITDVNHFLKQVHKLQEEKQENHKLIQLYEENKELLTQLFLEEQQKDKVETVTENKEIEKNHYYLHDTIFNRLGTGKIYEEVRKFFQSYSRSETQVSQLEMNIGEQTSIAQSFTLNNLKNQILKQHTPVYYYHSNSYEMASPDEEMTLEEEKAKLSSAVLLNLTNQIYALKQQSIEKNQHNWYSIAGALFETAENTWKRYEEYHQNGDSYSQTIHDNIEQLSVSKKKEIQVLTGIQKQYQTISKQYKVMGNPYTSTQEQYHFHDNKVEAMTRQSNVYQTTNPQLELEYLIAQQEETENQPLDAVTVEKIKEQLRVVDEKNLENIRKIQEIQKQQPRIIDVKVDKQKAKLDALRALENPEEVLKEYLTTERVSKPEIKKQQIDNQIYQMFSDETKAIFEQLEQNNRVENHIVLEHPPIETKEPVSFEEPKVKIPENSPVIHEIKVMAQKLGETNKEQTRIKQEGRRILEEMPKRIHLDKTEASVMQKPQKDKKQNMAVIEHLESELYHDTVESEQRLETTRNVIETQMRDIFHLEAKPVIQREVFHNVSLVHKQEEELITEDVLDVIRQQTQETIHMQTVDKKNIQEHKLVENNVQQVTNQVTTQQILNMEELVQENVRKQIGKISDQVYSKIEKRLQTERKRRGL